MAVKGAVDSFLVLLGIALVLLVILTVIFGVFGGQLGVTGISRTLATFTDLGPVGFLQELPSTYLTLSPFTAGTKQLDTLKKVPEVSLSAGAFGSQSLSLTIPVPSYYEDSLTGVKISFDVYQAGASNLRVKWNGKEVFVDVAGPRPQSIFVPKEEVKNINFLDITVDGPGLTFWVSNSYTLRDLTVAVEYGPAKLFAVELSGTDLQTFTRGELSFFSLGEGGTLLVKINGAPIFQKNARGPQLINFSVTSAPFAIGNNIFSFSATGGEFDLRNGEIKIFTVGNERTKELSFTLTADQLATITSGTVSVTLSSVTRPGGIAVKLNGQAILGEPMNVGTLTSSIAKTAFKEGENKLVVSGTGATVISALTVGG